MVGRQVDIDIRVPGAHRGGSAVGEVDAAVGQTDVIDDAAHLLRRDDVTDRGLDLIAQRRGLLDARAGAGTQVQFDLAAVHRREEVLAQAGQRTYGEGQHGGDGHGG